MEIGTEFIMKGMRDVIHPHEIKYYPISPNIAIKY